jgi:hypothetical protein
MTAPADNTRPVSSEILPTQPSAPVWGAGQQFAPSVQRQQGYGHPGQIRSVGMVLILGWITLGIYSLVIHYKVNKEMKEFTSAVSVNPVLAVLAWFLPFGGLVTVLGTTSRAGQCQAVAGLRADTSGFVSFLCLLVGAQGAYHTAKLNRVWQHVAATQY